MTDANRDLIEKRDLSSNFIFFKKNDKVIGNMSFNRISGVSDGKSIVSGRPPFWLNYSKKMKCYVPVLCKLCKKKPIDFDSSNCSDCNAFVKRLIKKVTIKLVDLSLTEYTDKTPSSFWVK